VHNLDHVSRAVIYVPAAIKATPARATRTPTLWGRARRSPRTNRASSTVTAEYRDPATETSDSNPWFVARAKRELARTSKQPIVNRAGMRARSMRSEGRAYA